MKPIEPIPRSGRRVLITNPQFQLKLIGFTVIIALFTIAIFYISNLYFIWKFIEIGREIGIPDTHPFFRFIVEQRRVMNSIFVITAVVASVATIAGGLLLSHRVAGALHRLESHMDEVAQSKEFKEVSFRRADFFSELADSYNHMMRELKTFYGRSSESGDTEKS